VFWNVSQHFWPYWNTVSGSWSRMLDVALADAADDQSVDDHVMTLERLSVGAPDGHTVIDCPGVTQRGYPPFAVDLVESQVVVTASSDSAIERGDVVLSVDGVTAVERLTKEESLLSGSPQWRLFGALQRFDTGPVGSRIGVRVRRGDQELEHTVARVREPVIEARRWSSIERLEDGSYYVDLSRATMADIDAAISQLAAAPGVVFDVRGSPRHNHQVLSYLMTRPDDLSGWELLPLIIRPDSASAPAGWEDTSTRDMPRLSVRQPHIAGRVAFMTGPGAISAAEDLMALVQHYHLGEIVGVPTAGTDGNFAQIIFPSGCRTWYTGRRVTKPGGGQHHLVGVQPTIPASRSVSGIRAGRDEVLEVALRYVRSGTPPKAASGAPGH
jgi:hypothetical protein